MEMDFLERIQNLYTRPFREEMDLLQWFLFIGLIMVAAFLWSRVLNSLRSM